MRGHTAIVDALLAHGANAKAANDHGRTPLHSAARQGHSAIVDALLAHGADVMAVDRRFWVDPAARCGGVATPRSSTRC